MATSAPLGPAGDLFERSISALDHVRRGLDADAVEAAIGVLARARDVVFVGRGASGIVARDAQEKFPLFGVPCSAPADLHQQLVAAAMSGPGSVVFAISQSGRTAETVRVACAARDAGATVVAMTGAPGPLSRVADVALVVGAGASAVGRLAELVVIDVLATGVLLRRGGAGTARVVPLRRV